jgi:FemAB-related protein (PEP-CTERM system-associated)
MHINLLDNTFLARWDDYVLNHPHGTFYHLAGWKETFEKSFGHQTFYLMAMDDDEITGVLPIVFINSYLFGKILCSLPYLNFAGVLSNNLEAETLLVEESKKLLNSHKADYMEYRQFNKILSLNHCQEHKVSMTVELDPNPEKLWAKLNTKHRTEVRKAIKQEVTIKYGKSELLPEFYQLISQGWRDLGTPIYSYSFFKNIAFILLQNIEIYVIYLQNRPVATAFNGFFKNIVEGMWTYALPEFRHLNVNNLLYWEMIRQSCERGFNFFHLGRSTKDSGAVFFKKKWNAVPQQLYWQYLLPDGEAVPQLNVDNPKYRFYINVWRKLPVKLTQIIGPPIAKNIP